MANGGEEGSIWMLSFLPGFVGNTQLGANCPGFALSTAETTFNRSKSHKRNIQCPARWFFKEDVDALILSRWNTLFQKRTRSSYLEKQ